jgi:hypothetical protein
MDRSPTAADVAAAVECNVSKFFEFTQTVFLLTARKRGERLFVENLSKFDPPFVIWV